MKEKHIAPREKQPSASCITKGLVLLFRIAIIGIIVQALVINKGDYTPVDLTSLRYTRAPDIPVNGSVSEMLFLPGERLLISDRDYNKSKMIDLHTKNLMFEVSLRACPWSMCILPEERLAVSLPDEERFQFLKTRGQLSLEGNIKVDGECFGIGYHIYRLIVSYWSGKVEIMGMTGNVIKTIDKDDSGQSIYSYPMYLQVVSEVQTSVIYVSNFGKSTINKLDMNLNILQTFQDPALIFPTGITTVGNQLLICGWKSNNIMFLNLLSGKMTQLLGEEEGIDRLRSVYYNHNQKTMYVTQNIESSVLVY